MSALADRVRQMLGIELHEVSGALLAGEIPLPDGLVNRLIAQRLATTQAQIAAVRVAAHDAGHLTIVLSLRGSLMPEVKIAAHIEQQPEFPAPAVLGLRWTVPGMGPLALFAGPALALFKKLPPGIRVEGERIEIALVELLRSQGLGEVADYITRVNVTTREGAVLLEFALRVP
jgi:hypothetical protein